MCFNLFAKFLGIIYFVKIDIVTYRIAHFVLSIIGGERCEKISCFSSPMHYMHFILFHLVSHLYYFLLVVKL